MTDSLSFVAGGDSRHREIVRKLNNNCNQHFFHTTKMVIRIEMKKVKRKIYIKL